MTVKLSPKVDNPVSRSKVLIDGAGKYEIGWVGDRPQLL